MDYKEKYEQALAKAKDIIASYEERKLKSQLFYAKEDFETIFPELAESEDEKLRKELIVYFNAYPKDYFGELKKSHILAWLEKQSDKTKIEALRTEYEKGRADALAECRFDYSKANIQQKDYAEQKPKEWSEEDEGMYCLYNNMMRCSQDHSVDTKLQAIEWLKSLKERI